MVHTLKRLNFEDVILGRQQIAIAPTKQYHKPVKHVSQVIAKDTLELSAVACLCEN